MKQKFWKRNLCFYKEKLLFWQSFAKNKNKNVNLVYWQNAPWVAKKYASFVFPFASIFFLYTF